MSSKIKDKLKDSVPESKEFTLTTFETAFIKEMDVLLQFHIGKQRIISNFITYIAVTRLGYSTVKEGYELRFDINLDRDPAIVQLRQVKAEQ